jgi:hypothetical protein
MLQCAALCCTAVAEMLTGNGALVTSPVALGRPMCVGYALVTVLAE